MINLFCDYNNNEILLRNSLIQAGYINKTIVLNDNGYLPLDILSPISFFTDMNSINTPNRTPLFFNDLSIPASWEIIGEESKATIMDGYKKKAIIKYSTRTGDYRLIQSVEWLNDTELPRIIDLYNQMGWCFGRKTYSDGEHVLTTYFDSSGREVILINHIVGTIQLDYLSKKYVFNSFEDFILFYFEVAEVPTYNINYNSLGSPFFILNTLKNKNPNIEYSHTLFWQEESQKMPENMKYLINLNNSSTKQVIVQDYSEYLRLTEQIKQSSKIGFHYLGYLYQFENIKDFQASAFILTNSDQIPQIGELIALLPNYKIIIAAKTEMSSILMNLEKFPNVKLYTQVTDNEIESLLDKSSIYLDINYGGEVNKVVYSAFQKNKLILSFAETIHDKRFIAQVNQFEASKFYHLTNEMNLILLDSHKFIESIAHQQLEAGQSSINKYKELLK